MTTTYDSELEETLHSYQSFQTQLANPNTYCDRDMTRELIKQYYHLKPVAETYQELQTARADYTLAQEYAHNDPSFTREAEQLRKQVHILETRLRQLVSSPNTHNPTIILEIRAGEGGEDATIFAAELLRAYTLYSQNHQWTVTPTNIAYTSTQNIREATLTIHSSDPTTPVWGLLQYETGVHRVQRVPATEAQGRKHTSTVGVLVYPKPNENTTVNVNDTDLKIDVYRSSGNGGQSVNTTNSAVRMTHTPTGITVTCQNERSQYQNKNMAKKLLTAKLQTLHDQETKQHINSTRSNTLHHIERAKKIRTYHYPENRITDHRAHYTTHTLNMFLEGHMSSFMHCIATKLESKILLKNIT